MAVGRDASGPRPTSPGRSDPVIATLFRHGVVTVSQSEDGFERVYQGTALLPAWEVPLTAGAVLTAGVRIEVTHSPPSRPDGATEGR